VGVEGLGEKRKITKLLRVVELVASKVEVVSIIVEQGLLLV
jgi:hypothetical protein